MTMSAVNAQAPRKHTPYAALLAFAMTATVGTALAFQHIGGYMPCKLCYEQRIPYYVGIPVMVLALGASLLRFPPVVVRLLLAIGGLLMAWGFYLGVFHAGVEWGYWPGPTDCGVVTPPPTGGSGGVLDQINTVIPPSCNEAALRVLGLSFAGWNAIASLFLAAVAFVGAAKR